MPAEHAKVGTAAVNTTAEQLAISTESGPSAKTNVAGILGVVSFHLRDHAASSETLRG